MVEPVEERVQTERSKTFGIEEQAYATFVLHTGVLGEGLGVWSEVVLGVKSLDENNLFNVAQPPPRADRL